MKNYIEINGKRTELTIEQMTALGIEVPQTKFELSYNFWVNRKTYFLSTDSEIESTFQTENYFDKARGLDLLPTKAHAEGLKVLPRLLMKQYEMNGGENPTNGHMVYHSELFEKWNVSTSRTHVSGFLFKTEDLAKQFLEENIEDLKKIKILGY